ncbi:MAG TPA: ribonuclease E/G, partial [Gaiellaceae bacterium]
RSTLSRRVDLPSGGYLVFDYAEAFTVIDVNTGRFVGSRGKGSGARLEDTITKNNLEAVKEVVRQLRLRDIGGIIVIDFIDMANPKNRAAVEEALRTELERDRTKTYVVEISPLGLVEMTRQNVTDGPREILTKKCPTCGGDGIVVSEATAAVEAERKLRALAVGSKAKAFRVELPANVAALVVGPGAVRLAEIETQTKRRFLIETKDEVHVDHFLVLAEGTLDELRPEAPALEGAEKELKLVEVGRYDSTAGVGKLDGLDISVAGAAGQVGKKVKVRIERVLDGTAYATRVGGAAKAETPITAESEAEKPTRKPPAKKTAAAAKAEPVEPVVEETREPEPAAEVDAEAETEEKPKRKSRRGSRGGRGRKRKTAAANGAKPEGETTETAETEEAAEPVAEAPAAPRIHVPDTELGEEAAPEPEAVPSEDGAGPTPAPKKKTRRGSRGGRGRKKKTPAAETTSEGAENGSRSGEWEYVPMSEWDSDLTS